MTNLRIGIPSKGRLAEVAGELLKEAGLSFRRQERTLFARCRELPVDVTFLRTEDIPVLCAEGAIDMGITGGDLIAESGANLVHRLELGVGECRLAVCVPEDHPATSPAALNGARVATSFPHVTEQFLAEHNAKAHLVTLSGSVEIMIALGVADAIVDLVETGSTLAANRLRVLAEVKPVPDDPGAESFAAAGGSGRPSGSPVGRRGDRPQLFAAGVQRAAQEAAGRRKDHAGLQLADHQRAGRRRLVCRPRDGAPHRSDRDHGAARSVGRERDPGNANHQLPAVKFRVGAGAYGLRPIAIKAFSPFPSFVRETTNNRCPSVARSLSNSESAEGRIFQRNSPVAALSA